MTSHRDPRVRLAIEVVTSSDNVVVTGLPTVAVIYPEHPGCPDPTRVNGVSALLPVGLTVGDGDNHLVLERVIPSRKVIGLVSLGQVRTAVEPDTLATLQALSPARVRFDGEHQTGRIWHLSLLQHDVGVRLLRTVLRPGERVSRRSHEARAA